MRVFLISRTLPAPTGVGSSVHVWSLLETLVLKGHEVRLCLSTNLSHVEEWRLRMYQTTSDTLESMGVEVCFIKAMERPIASRPKRFLGLLTKTVAPSVSDFYQEDPLEAELRREIEAWSPDALCLWEIEAVVAARKIAPEMPRLAFFTDPDHLVRQTRRRYRAVPSPR